jgi:hypothetical protein
MRWNQHHHPRPSSVIRCMEPRCLPNARASSSLLGISWADPDAVHWTLPPSLPDASLGACWLHPDKCRWPARILHGSPHFVLRHQSPRSAVARVCVGNVDFGDWRMAQVGLACVCGSRARSAAEGAELGWLPAWLGRFLFSFFFSCFAFFCYYFLFRWVVK